MKNTRALPVVIAATCALGVAGAQPPAPQGPDYNAYYQIGPDSLPHEGVPKGEVRGPFENARAPPHQQAICECAQARRSSST